MFRRVVSAAALAASLIVAAPPSMAQPPAAKAPSFSYDLNWMKVPSQYVVGDISAVAVDSHDNIWVLHRPRTLPVDQRAKAAPPVMEFDRTGKFIRAWGGPGEPFEWPTNEHSLYVDAQDRVWIAGSDRTAGKGDDMVLAFTAAGKFIRQIGRRGANGGDQDVANVYAPADLYVDTLRHELYVADGYGNRRLIVFDTETGAFKRMWGAFGGTPPFTPKDPPTPTTRQPGDPDQTGEGSVEFSSVHGVELSKDGLVYVSDRDSQRVQVFDREGVYRGQVFIDRQAQSRQTASGLALSADPGQRWLYVADWGNHDIVVVDRKALTVAGSFGSRGTQPGQFIGPHLMATDSKGVLYVAEVQGRRLQRLTPKP